MPLPRARAAAPWRARNCWAIAPIGSHTAGRTHVVALAGLADDRLAAQITTQPYRDFIFRLDPTIAFLKSIGVWQLPHPWRTLFLPADATHAYVSSLLSTLTPADTGQGPLLLYPFDTAKLGRPLFRVPASREAFHFSVLRTATPPTRDVITRMLANNRSLYDQAVAVGATRYIIGAIPDFTPSHRKPPRHPLRADAYSGPDGHRSSSCSRTLRPHFASRLALL